MTPETDVINWEEYPYITDDIKFVDDMITKYAKEWLSDADINTILRKTSSAVDTYNKRIWTNNWTPLESEAAIEKLRLAGKDFLNKRINEYSTEIQDALDILDQWISDDITLIDHLNKRQWELRWEYASQKYQWNPKKFSTKLKQTIKKVRPFKSVSKTSFAWKVIAELADIWELNIIELNKALSKIWKAYASLNEWNPSKVKAVQNKINEINNTINKLLDTTEDKSNLFIEKETSWKSDLLEPWKWRENIANEQQNIQTKMENNRNDMEIVTSLKNNLVKQFIDLLKEWGTEEEWLAEVKDFIQNSLFDL